MTHDIKPGDKLRLIRSRNDAPAGTLFTVGGRGVIANALGEMVHIVEPVGYGPRNGNYFLERFERVRPTTTRYVNFYPPIDSGRDPHPWRTTSWVSAELARKNAKPGAIGIAIEVTF